MVDGFECAGVSRIGFDRAAIEIAGELVEQQDKRQCAVRGVPPAHELARAGARHQVAEADTDFFIDRRTAFVPPAATGQGSFRIVAAVPQPEGDEVGDEVGDSCPDCRPRVRTADARG